MYRADKSVLKPLKAWSKYCPFLLTIVSLAVVQVNTHGLSWSRKCQRSNKENVIISMLLYSENGYLKMSPGPCWTNNVDMLLGLFDAVGCMAPSESLLNFMFPLPLKVLRFFCYCQEWIRGCYMLCLNIKPIELVLSWRRIWSEEVGSACPWSAVASALCQWVPRRRQTSSGCWNVL